MNIQRHKSVLLFLALVLTGCNYASQYEAQLACEKWVKKGGIFYEHYKNPSFNPEPQEEDCSRMLASPPNNARQTEERSSIVIDEEALCRLQNKYIQEEREAGLFDERRYIEEGHDLRQCSLEEQTRQYLGFTIESIQVRGKTILLSNGKRVDPTGGALYKKEILQRFRY